MDKILYTYSLVKALFDKGEDYIDSFWPFVLQVLDTDKKRISIEEIKSRIKQKYGLDIPIHSLNVIITRAKRKDFMLQEKRKYSLLDEGIKELENFESDRDIERKNNELYSDAQIFFNNKLGSSHDTSYIKELIEVFVSEHIEYFIEYFSPDDAINLSDSEKKILEENEITLLDYFRDVELRKPDIYDTLQNIIRGCIITSTIYNKDFETATENFDNTQIVFDTNFLISILGLHYDEYNVPCLELFDMLKGNKKFSFHVFDFTIDEFTRVLSKYPEESLKCTKGVKVGSLYSSLKNKGWGFSDVKKFIFDIEDKLEKLRINIMYEHINLEDPKLKYENLRSKLVTYKPTVGIYGQNHDLAVLEVMQRRRSKIRRKIENSKIIFISSDLNLSRFNFIEMGHRKNSTICEVIPDRLLTNILWLKSPKMITTISLGTIIALHSRKLFIDRDVWSLFYKTLIKMKEEQIIKVEDMSMLIYDNHIQDILRTSTTKDISNLKEEDISKLVTASKERQDDMIKTKIDEHKLKSEEDKNIFINKEKKLMDDKITLMQKQLEKVNQDTEIRNKRILENLIEKKKIKKDESEKIANLIYYPFIFLLSVLISFFLYLLSPFVVKQWNTIEPYKEMIQFGLILLSLLGINIGGLTERIRDEIKDYLISNIYKFKIKNIIELEELL